MRELYQIGGYRNGRWGEPDELARRLFLNNGAGTDLILGILPNGASYMLQPGNPAGRPYGYKWLSQDFLSLSPIHFSTLEGLAEKLKSYVSKKAGRDRSQANRSYTDRDEKLIHNNGIARSNFEHQR